MPQSTIQVAFNTAVTSRILEPSLGLSEALLLIDEPYPTSMQNAVTPPVSIAGTGTGIGVYDGSPGRPNVFQGVQGVTMHDPSDPFDSWYNTTNAIEFTNVPVDPPGLNFPPAPLVLRITNIRVDAHAPGFTAGPNVPPPAVLCRVRAFGGPQIPAASFPQQVAIIRPPTQFVARASDDSSSAGLGVKDCSGVPASLLPLPSGESGSVDFNVKFTGAFGSFDRVRTIATPDPPDSPPPADQNIPGANYNTETGFFVQEFTATNGLNLAGLADYGTRLEAKFQNVPPGVSISVTATPSPNGTTAGPLNGANIVCAGSGACSGPYSPLPDTSSVSIAGQTVGLAPVPLSNGTGSAVWEILASLSDVFPPTLSFGVVVSNPTSIAGAFQVSGALAPVSTNLTTGTIPRFADLSSGSVLDLSSLMNVTRSSLHYVFPTHYQYSEQITVTNTSAITLQAPLYLAIDSLTAGVSIFGNPPVTHCGAPSGSPVVPVSVPNNSLKSGQSGTALVVFNAPSTSAFTYTTRVLNGLPAQ